MTARITLAFTLLGLLLLCACKSAPPTTSAPVPMPETFDACALLTPADIKDIQGEEPVESKPTQQSDGSVVMHQCFFRLEEFSKSVSLSAAAAGTAYWERMFAERPGSEEEEERERGGRSSPRRQIRGLGDEAYWLSTRVGGTLYVRQGGDLLRIGIGGKASDTDRLANATALARRALPRLPKR